MNIEHKIVTSKKNKAEIQSWLAIEKGVYNITTLDDEDIIIVEIISTEPIAAFRRHEAILNTWSKDYTLSYDTHDVVLVYTNIRDKNDK